jgi:transposase InsO family protein
MGRILKSITATVVVLGNLIRDGIEFLQACVSSRTSLAAENLFLRKQLSFYQEHNIRPRRLTNSARVALVFWSRFFDWQPSLLIIKPATLIGWHRKAFSLFWKWKSRPGRPRLPKDLRQLIAEMVRDNPTWGQERIADELWLKLGIRVSPRTVRAYWPGDGPSIRQAPSQNWNTFLRNHAEAVVACDFFVAVTVRFRILYVLVVMEIASRRIVGISVTEHPTAEWTIQQLRQTIPSDHSYRFLIHDRHATFSPDLDDSVRTLGIAVLKTPVRTPQANAFCERLIGTVRCECLDYMIPINERHLRQILRTWVSHYNRGRPHSSLGPGIPDPYHPRPSQRAHRHRLTAGEIVTSTAVLSGLHHEYRLDHAAA